MNSKSNNGWIRKYSMILCAMLSLLISLPEDAFARSVSRSGGFSSSRPSSTTSRPSSASKPSYTAPKPSTPAPSSGWSSSRPSTTTARPGESSINVTSSSVPKRSSVDSAAFESASKKGTAYTSKTDAEKAFVAKNSTQFKQSPAPGKAEPSSRPSHIPNSTTVDGKTYNVTYNVGAGGYGYTNALGAFVLYDAITDAAMMNSLMNRNSYYYPGVAGPVYVNDGGGGFSILLWIGVGFLVLVIIVGIATARS